MIKTKKILLFIFSAVFCVSIMRLFIFDITVIKGKSMEPLLNEGELFVVNRASYGILVPFTNQYLIRWGVPIYGDIILYNDPVSKLKTVKRCIAVPGDPILMKDNTLYIRDYEIPLKFYQLGILKNYSEVPENSVFVLGENIENSSDSRSVGFIDIESIKGAAFYEPESRSPETHSHRENQFRYPHIPAIVKK